MINKRGTYMAQRINKIAEAEPYLEKYLELKEKFDNRDISDEELEIYFDIKDFALSYKRYIKCMSSIELLNKLIKEEDDKQVRKIYSEDLTKIEDEAEKLKKKIYKELKDDDEDFYE